VDFSGLNRIPDLLAELLGASPSPVAQAVPVAVG